MEKLPSVVVFENVAGLLHRKHKAVFHTVRRVLKVLGYNVSHKLVNTKDHGIPQSRPRVYIIGTDRGGSAKMFWPREIPCVGVEYFLQLKGVPTKLEHMSPTAKRSVKAAKKRWSKEFKARGMRSGSEKAGIQPLGYSRILFCVQHMSKVKCALRNAMTGQVNWDDQHIFVDAQAGQPFASSQHRTCPCITKSRGGSRGFYILSARRWMTIHEIAGFQGMPSWVTDRFLQKGISEAILGRALGDAMSLNVLMRVLPRALLMSGVLNVLPNDLWEGAVLTFGKRHMPDALLGKGRRD
jgi:site-specific DNA-cytosine methylase